MGLMDCSRKDCNYIMCQTHISEVGYICSDCKDEFREYLKKQGIVNSTQGEIMRQLKFFIKTEKGLFITGKPMNIDEFFNLYTHDEINTTNLYSPDNGL